MFLGLANPEGHLNTAARLGTSRSLYVDKLPTKSQLEAVNSATETAKLLFIISAIPPILLLQLFFAGSSHRRAPESSRAARHMVICTPSPFTEGNRRNQFNSAFGGRDRLSDRLSSGTPKIAAVGVLACENPRPPPPPKNPQPRLRKTHSPMVTIIREIRVIRGQDFLIFRRR